MLLIVGMSVCCSFALVAETLWIDDASGGRVPIEAPIERAISIYGLGTYYFYALGAGNQLILGGYIGVKTLAQAPVPLRAIEPRLAEKMTFGTPNLEAIAALDPDLIIVDATRHAEFAELAEEIGLVVLRQKLETPESVRQTMIQLGELLGEEAARRSALYADFADRALSSAGNASRSIPAGEQTSVLFLGSTPQSVASGDMLQSRMIELAGGICVSHELRGGWNDVDLEQILVWNPEVIVVPAYATFEPTDLVADPDWAGLQAVRSGRVYQMPRVMGPWDTAVPDFVLGVLWMSDRFYPDGAEIDWVAETAIFYETFYGYSLPVGWADDLE